MAIGSPYFRNYHQSLRRVTFAEMLDAHMQSQSKRRLSIVGPCYTHEQWVAAQEERRNSAAVAAQQQQRYSATADQTCDVVLAARERGVLPR